MGTKTTYTEGELKAFMEKTLGKTAEKLGLSAAEGDFDEPVNETLYVLGIADLTSISSLDEVHKLRTVAKVEAWRSVTANSVHEASHSAGAPGTGQVNRGEIFRHAKDMFDLALSEMLEKYPLLGSQLSSEVSSYKVTYDGDLY